MADLKKLNPLYWKKDKGKIVEGTGPTLYAKLISSKKHNKILSMFFNMDGDSIDPLSLLGKYCYSKAAVKIESIFIGNKISLQVKLYEAEIELMDSGMKPLMSRPKVTGMMLPSSSQTTSRFDTGDLDDDVVGAGSLPASDEEESFKPVQHTPPVKAPVQVKRIIKKGGKQ